MSFWAIVPAKDPGDAKSRLAPVLPQPARRELVLLLFRRTLQVLAQVPGCDQCVVVSASSEVLAIARDLQCDALQESWRAGPRTVVTGQRDGVADAARWDGQQGPEYYLNAALEQGARYAGDRGADAIMVVPADLPFLNPQSLVAVVEGAPDEPGITIVPDRSRTGTNILFAKPPLALPFSYGVDSFSRHCRAAAARGLACAVLEAPLLAIDLDSPSDLDEIAYGDRMPQADAALVRLARSAYRTQGRRA